MFELSYDEIHLSSLVVPDRHTHTQTHRQTDRQTDLGVELTSPFGRGQLKTRLVNPNSTQRKVNRIFPTKISNLGRDRK